ncbi:MAG: LamB/YcsF family protein [Flaviaesturariibacter sp.]|nr:LamB/YcsF family protein [Flaviaesturariibacter sp.]
MQVDLNCDMAEGMGNEAAIIPFITAANIACGFHAGDEQTMRHVVRLCLGAGVSIGAHPSYPDREEFGRRDLAGTTVKPTDLHGIVTEQLEALRDACRFEGASLTHVKLHGALYNRAAWDEQIAHPVCQAIADTDPSLIVYALSGSRMHDIATSCGLRTMHEVFADRTYQDDGSLTPRSMPGALVSTREAAAEQARRMIVDGTVRTLSGKVIPIIAQTICLHGDGPHAVAFARLLHSLVNELKTTSPDGEPTA